MNVHVVDQRHCFIGSDRIRAFHSEMFHGCAMRDGNPFPHNPSLYQHNAPQSPLHIVRNAFAIPDIFAPAENIIVSETIRAIMEGLPNISFQAVVFDKLYALEYHAGDFSFFAPKNERPAHYRGLPYNSERIPEKFLDITAARQEVGNYFEVVVPLARELRKHFQFKEMQVVLDAGPCAETRVVDIFPDVMCNYPVYKSGGAWVFDDPVFENLRPYFDWDYFVTTPI